MEPQEQLSAVSELDDKSLASMLRTVPRESVADVVKRSNPSKVARALATMDRPDAVSILHELPTDDATDVLLAIPIHLAEDLLADMDPADERRLRQLMTYPSDSAGGRMTTGFVAVPTGLHVDDAIDVIRQAVNRAETIFYIYVVDERQRCVGVLSLASLMLAPSGVPVRDLIRKRPISVHVDTDQEQAARLLIRHNLLALPVLDAAGRLVGILTEDDVADVLEEEATEDIERLGGSQPLEVAYRDATIPLLFRRRIVWLLVLFVAEAYTGTVMRLFENELEQVVALAFFVPLLIGTGGNIGSQITTTLVRAMAIDEVSLRDVRWILTKEAGVGIVIGAVMAAVAYGRAELLGVGADIALVVAIAIAVISLWSSLVAAVLPLVLRKLRFDPTVVSAPFITTLVDGTGLIIYFTIAKFILGL